MRLLKHISIITLLFVTISLQAIVCPVLAFSDINSVDDELFYNIANTLTGMEVLNGYPDGTFLPNKNVTRAEFSVILVRLFGMEENLRQLTYSDNVFSDIHEHWAKNYITYSAKYSIISGMGNGLFEPEGNVTYAQEVKMIVCALGLKTEAEIRGGWPLGYVSVADEIGLTRYTKGTDINLCCTRKITAMLIINAYHMVINTSESTGFITVVDEEMQSRPTFLLSYVMIKLPELVYIPYEEDSEDTL